MSEDNSDSRRRRLWSRLDFRQSISRSRSRSRSRSGSTSGPQIDSSSVGQESYREPRGSSQYAPNQFKSQNSAAVAMNHSLVEHACTFSTGTTATSEQSDIQNSIVQIKIELADPDNTANSPERLDFHQATDNSTTEKANIISATTPTAEKSDSKNVVIKVEVPDGEGSREGKDIWTAAYREAVERLDEDKRDMVMKSDRINQLLEELRDRDAENAENSPFRKGLKKLQKPLQYVKLAVDLAKPFAELGPVAGTATGAVKSFTVVAINICGVNDALSAQITKMLEYTEIIDDCDTLGQKLIGDDTLHKGLVPVYTDLLEFYLAAMKFYSHRQMALGFLSEALNEKLPPIIMDFFSHASQLQDMIRNATLTLVDDIKRLLLDDKILKLLGVDKDRDRSEHHCNMRNAKADGACTWITQNPAFLKWYNASTAEFLVMFGAMGYGKTVTTAFVINHLIHLNKNFLPRPLICYHYCNTEENSDTVYIYSSLLLQLFNQRPGLKIKFDKWHTDRERAKLIDPAQSSKELGNFFAECIKSLDRTVIVVIDAIDECNDQSRRELIALLRGIAKETPRLKVFFSSRPNEETEGLLDGAAQIRLLPDRARDVAIVNCLVGNNLPGLPQQTRDLVVGRLCDAAGGSAIWIKLTVDLIRKRKINAYGRMQNFLEEMPLPSNLSELYLKLFHQASEGEEENERLATRALEILAVAKRPLSILELGWALAFEDIPEDVASDMKVQDLEGWVDEKRVLNLVQPFVGHVDFDDVKKRQVMLVHQSLKLLILRRPPSAWEKLRNLDKMSKAEKIQMEQRQSELEAQLLSICVRYLLLDEFDHDEMTLFSEDQQKVEILTHLPQGDGLFDDSDDADAPDQDGAATATTTTGQVSDTNAPSESSATIYFDPAESGFGEFFVYASCYWLEHFQLASWERSPDISDVVQLCRAKSNRLRNWVDQHCRPDCTILPKLSWASDLLDPLVITSTFGPAAAMEAILANYNATGPEFLGTSVATTIKHLVSYRRTSRLCSFFRQEHVGLTPQTLPLFMSAMGEWANLAAEGCDKDEEEGLVEFFDLVYAMVPLLVTDSWGNELLCEAARSGCLPVIERLFDAAEQNPELRTELLSDRQRQVDPKRHDRHQSVGEAVWSNHIDVLRYLLQQPGIDAHLRHRDLGGANVFCAAARYSNPEVVRLLVEHYPEGVNELDESGDAPLSEFAFAHSSVEVVRILLEAGADVRRGNVHPYWNPLRIAVRNMDVEMCRTLVELGGADPLEALRVDDNGCALGLADPISSDKGARTMLDMFCRLGCLKKVEAISTSEG